MGKRLLLDLRQQHIPGWQYEPWPSTTQSGTDRIQSSCGLRFAQFAATVDVRDCYGLNQVCSESRARCPHIVRSTGETTAQNKKTMLEETLPPQCRADKPEAR